MHRMFFLLVFCAFTAVNAQLLPGAKPVQAHMTDSAGKLLLMDFGIKLTGIKDVNTPFSVFSSRPLMLYYFSPFCPHCQRSYGGVQQVAKEYEQKGLTSLAISVGSGATKRDILKFMEEQKASIPFYQDADQDFSKKYGDGYVPRLYLVSPDGKIVRYSSLENENLKEIKADIEKLLGLSK